MSQGERSRYWRQCWKALTSSSTVARRTPCSSNSQRYWRLCWRAAVSSLAIGVVSFVSYRLHFNAATAELLYLLVIVGQSLQGGFASSAVISLEAAVCLDLFFLPPLFSLRIADPFNVLALFVFLAIALVITHLVSRMRVEAEWAGRRSTNLQQLYRTARQLFLVSPDCAGGAPMIEAFREGMSAAAVCLFDAATGELYIDGTSQCGLPQRTKQCYIAGEDSSEETGGTVIRSLRVSGTSIGAIGFEGLPDAEWTAGPLSVLAVVAMQQARAFRKVSQETAAAQAETFRTAILDALAHEFKTPLATMLAVVGGLLESARLGAEEFEMVSILESEVSRLNALTNRVLLMARLDREEVKPRMRHTNIPDLVERVVRRYDKLFPDAHVSVNCHCDASEVPADPELMDLALTQLLDNAFKYSTPGSLISLTIRREQGFVAVRVQNEGSPIPPQEQNLIFERFYRGTIVRKLISGAGLGLYVARKITLAHGGSLNLDRTYPGHVVFCLKLPVTPELNNILNDNAFTNN